MQLIRVKFLHFKLDGSIQTQRSFQKHVPFQMVLKMTMEGEEYVF